MRAPITNKTKPETNFIVFPTISPLSFIITLYLTIYTLYQTLLINLMEKNTKISPKSLDSNTFLDNSNINIVKNPK